MASAEADNELAYAMVGGDGHRSYSHNSVYQRHVMEVVKELVSQSIAEKLHVNVGSNLFCIADLGCSVGPNTFSAVENIIDAVEKKLKLGSEPEPDFHVLFNDHSENDFNALFRSLPPRRRYFAAGVPGSFHLRLFPKSTLHFVHASYSLHWLSKIPREVVDPKSAAWNGGDMYCSGRVGAVQEAYAAQFSDDLEGFLNARAQEMVGGGLMAITVGGLEDDLLLHNSSIGFVCDVIGSCLSDLANQGRTSKEKVETFNMPLYYPHKEELLQVMSKNENFNIERVDVINIPFDYDKLGIPIASFVASNFRATSEDLITKHFGCEIVDPLFQLLEEKLEDKSMNQGFKNTSIFTLLKRKI